LRRQIPKWDNIAYDMKRDQEVKDVKDVKK
jgi:hypothetical protein